jgi:CHAT domain-containing protein/tetratricopeptide (TPR) repeat protein
VLLVALVAVPLAWTNGPPAEAQGAQEEPKAGPTEREKLGQQARERNERALQLYEAGKIADALALFRSNLALWQRLYPSREYPQGHPDLANSLHNLGFLLQAAGQLEAARSYHEQALAMRQQLFPARQYPHGHPDLATSLHELGSNRHAAGQVESARHYYERALAMRQQLYPISRYPQGHPDLASSLAELGLIRKAAGQYEAARGYYEQALAMYQQLYPASRYPQGHSRIATTLSNLALLLRAAGQYEAARDRAEQALIMFQQLYPVRQYPQGHPNLAGSLNNLGLQLQAVGQYEAARDKFEKALAMFQQLYTVRQYAQGHPALAASLHSLGALLQAAGQYEAARGYHEQALTMYQQLYPASRYPQGHPHLYTSLNDLGLLLRAAGQYEAARSYCERALAMTKQLYPASQYPQGHPYLALSLSNLGVLLQEAGHPKEARGYHEQALAMFQQLYPSRQYPQGHPQLAHTLNNLGALLKTAGQGEAARGYFEQALAMTQKLYPVSQYPQGHPQLVVGLNNLGYLLQEAGQYEEARRYLKQAVVMSFAQSVRDTALAPEAQALDLLRRLPRARDLYLAAALRAGIEPGTLYAELWPSRGLVSRLLQRRHQAIRVRLQADPKVQEAWQDLVLTRAELARRLSASVADLGQRDKELARLTERKEALERTLAKLLPELDRSRELDRLGPADLAALLPPGQAFVDLWRYKHLDKKGEVTARYLGFVVLSGGAIKLVELQDADSIDRAVQAWRAKIAQGQDEPADARAVAARLWEPLARVLPADTKVVYLAPDGELARLPWAALPGRKEGTVLLEELTLAVVPHGPFLVEQLKYPLAQPPGPERVVALGDVAYGPAEAPVYQALPGTAAELNKLRELAGPREVTLLQQDQAGWPQLQRALAQARYAHLATHGYYDAPALARERQRQEQEWRDRQFGREHVRGGQAARTPLAFTGLALAGANWPQGEIPTIVTGEALVELPLENLRLCVLSACETGLGDLGPLTGEAVQGLPQALHLAGCPNVISSLWNVNDQATAALMAKLYDGLWREGKTPLEALRQAQLLVYRHPERIVELAERGPTALKTVRLPTGGERGRTAATKLWAGFVLSGSGR